MNFFKLTTIFFLFVVVTLQAQSTFTINKLQAKIKGNLICSYVQNGDTNFTYLKLTQDSIFVDLVLKRNEIYLDWTSSSAPLSSIDPLLSRVIEVGLSDQITYPKAGIVQVVTTNYQKKIFYRMVDEKRDTTLYSESLNLICCSLNDAVLGNGKLPD